jgi:hypothetical protein
VTRSAARNEVADRRFAAASIPAGSPPKPPTFRTDTPYLSLGNVTRAECRAAAATVTDIALRVGHGDQCGLPGLCAHPGHLWDAAVSDMVLDILKLKEFAR